MVKVSVIIPAYNRGHFIAETIDSALAQTYQDYEIIVVDDGSTDNTKEAVEHYGNKVRYFYQENRGQAAAQNFAARQAKGEYLALLDADDVWFPEKLEKQVPVLDQNPDLGFVCTETFAYENGKKLYHWKKPEGKTESFQSIFEGNFIINATVLIRKDCFLTVGGFDEKLRTTQDLDLWLRLSRKYKFRYLNIPLVKYRLHAQNLHKNAKQKLKDHLYIFSKEDNVGHLDSRGKRIKIAREYYDFVPDFLKQKDYFNAGICCLKAILTYPFVGYYYVPYRPHKIKSSMPYRILKIYYFFAFYLLKAALKGRPKCRTAS